MVGLRAVGHPDCGQLAWCWVVRRRTATDFAATRLEENRIADGVRRSFDSPHLIDRTLVVNAADTLSESQVLGVEPKTRGTAWNRGQPVCARGQGMIRGAHKGLPVSLSPMCSRRTDSFRKGENIECQRPVPAPEGRTRCPQTAETAGPHRFLRRALYS